MSSSSSSMSSLSFSFLLLSSSLEAVSLFAFATAAAVAGFTLRLATRLFFCSLLFPLLLFVLFESPVALLSFPFFKAINFGEEQETSSMEDFLSVAPLNASGAEDEDKLSSSSTPLLLLLFPSSTSSLLPNESSPATESSSKANLASRFLPLPTDFRNEWFLLSKFFDVFG